MNRASRVDVHANGSAQRDCNTACSLSRRWLEAPLHPLQRSRVEGEAQLSRGRCLKHATQTTHGGSV
jgi:hypothetical protein